MAWNLCPQYLKSGPGTLYPSQDPCNSEKAQELGKAEPRLNITGAGLAVWLVEGNKTARLGNRSPDCSQRVGPLQADCAC